uniref:Uncharacterized protein n=1 Tax=Leersia perrieri TaxID=77586 RepID=A0A0D9VX07_9ORYZ
MTPHDVLDTQVCKENFLVCVRPCLLPSGISLGCKSKNTTYEFYHPSVTARQLGLGYRSSFTSWIGFVQENWWIHNCYMDDSLISRSLPMTHLIPFRCMLLHQHHGKRGGTTGAVTCSIKQCPNTVSNFALTSPSKKR